MSKNKAETVCFEATHKNVDEFFCKQPSPEFVEELKKPIHSEKPPFFGNRFAEPEEIDLRGMYLDISFPDDGGLLKTAYADFETFLNVYKIKGDKCRIHIQKAETSCFEEYTVSVSKEEVSIKSGDTEGVRRALVYLEDILTESEGAFLKPGTVTRKPVIKSRITRGFFSPTNRPPHNIDELWDDVDYYPDEYLNRLVHDGNNGIWIYTHFKDLIPSAIIPEYGDGSEIRIAKLKKVVAKCARYGIKVYVFAVEPWGLTPEMAEKYPDIPGSPGYDRLAFCTRSDRGREYCIESVQRLFTLVPDLGGYIDITAGERVTSCASAGNIHKCPRCSKYSRGETLAYTADLIREGMRRAGAKGEFISWTYGQRVWNFEDIKEYVRKVPDDVKLMQNIEDYGFAEQLGKERFGIDYWLSYPGPSYLFEETAKESNKYQKHLYAKMQVCCSHELATVPYIPVPGLVFKKYAGAYKYKVEGVLQCWYFGNYPSIMSKAAGILSFTEDFSNEDKFLNHLAGILYGRSTAKSVTKAWKYFAEGYANYPLNIMFSYYGPMHDGVAWELQLIPKNITLPRSWLLPDKPNGDRIGDCLRQSHTLTETIELCEKICSSWKKGLDVLPIDKTGEMETLSKSLAILFESGTNILKFYKLREELGYITANPTSTLNEMKAIVENEIENTNRMIVMCEADCRLGYHSEAEGFKFFPSKLKYRAEQLKRLLETEFPIIYQRIAEGKAPLEYYTTDNKNCYVLTKDINKSKEEKIGDKGSFLGAYDNENIYLEIKCNQNATVMLCFENRLMVPECEILIDKDGKPYLPDDIDLYVPLYGNKFKEEYGKYRIQRDENVVRIIADRKRCNSAPEKVPFKLCIKIDNTPWVEEEAPVYNLGRNLYSANEFGWAVLD